MTEKQEAAIRNKILQFKQALAADKKMWGGYYHDGRGIRYLLPELFIKLKDYKGGVKYLNWYDKNFPDDGGDPIFLFQATFILHKAGKFKEAEKKARETFFSNTYLFYKFLDREHQYFDTYDNPNWELEDLVIELKYSKTDPEFTEFAIWIDTLLKSPSFASR